jgi:hypothetical protein
MADLTPIEVLQRSIAAELPTARINLDAPHLPSGSWFVDVEWNGALAFVEWRPLEGFGVSPESAGYGEGPDVTTKDVAAAAAATVGLLRSQRGFRDALIVADETALRTTLRDNFLEVDVTSDSVGVHDAVAQLRRHMYRSVIVDTRVELSQALVEELAASVRHVNVITVALLAGSGRPEVTSDWAQIFVRHTIDARNLAVMVRTLLRYSNDPFAWPRLHRDVDDSK